MIPTPARALHTPLASSITRYSVLALFLAIATVGGYSQDKPNFEDPKKLIKQALKLSRSGNISESEKILKRAAELEGPSNEAKTELAYLLVKQRDIIGAYEMIFPIVKADNRNARALAVLGTTLLTAGRFPEARVFFYNAIKNDRKEHLAWMGMGMLDYYENNINQGLGNLYQAVHHGPNEPDYLFALAQVASRAERYIEAADAYKEFLYIANPSDKDRRNRIKGLITFLRYLGESGPLYRTGGREHTSVPFSLEGNRPIIKLKVNGREEPLRFVLDTGSGISVISNETAKRLKIKAVARGGHAKGIGGDGKFEIVYGLLSEIKVGDVSLRQVPVYIREFHNDSVPVDGYIGLALISKFLTTVDYGEKTMSLTRKDIDNKLFQEKDELSLPLRLTSSGFLSGEVHLEGFESPLNFIVDTGASISVISQAVARTDQLTGLENAEKLRVIGSAGITGEVPTFQLPKVSFGKHSRRDITAVALNLDIINEVSGFEQSGILGGNFLKNYRLTFDFKNSKVIFVSIKPDAEQRQ